MFHRLLVPSKTSVNSKTSKQFSPAIGHPLFPRAWNVEKRSYCSLHIRNPMAPEANIYRIQNWNAIRCSTELWAAKLDASDSIKDNVTCCIICVAVRRKIYWELLTRPWGQLPFNYQVISYTTICEWFRISSGITTSLSCDIDLFLFPFCMGDSVSCDILELITVPISNDISRGLHCITLRFSYTINVPLPNAANMLCSAELLYLQESQ